MLAAQNGLGCSDLSFHHLWTKINVTSESRESLILIPESNGVNWAMNTRWMLQMHSFVSSHEPASFFASVVWVSYIKGCIILHHGYEEREYSL